MDEQIANIKKVVKSSTLRPYGIVHIITTITLFIHKKQVKETAIIFCKLVHYQSVLFPNFPRIRNITYRGTPLSTAKRPFLNGLFLYVNIYLSRCNKGVTFPIY